MSSGFEALSNLHIFVLAIIAWMALWIILESTSPTYEPPHINPTSTTAGYTWSALSALESGDEVLYRGRWYTFVKYGDGTLLLSNRGTIDTLHFFSDMDVRQIENTRHSQ